MLEKHHPVQDHPTSGFQGAQYPPVTPERRCNDFIRQRSQKNKPQISKSYSTLLNREKTKSASLL